MQEQTSLARRFDDSEGVSEQALELSSDEEFSVVDAFHLPKRNWNLIIDSFNTENKRKFLFTPLQCAVIVEYVKKGQPPANMFRTLGISPQKQSSLATLASQLEERMERLASKEELNQEEYDEFNKCLRHPTRILMADISRAEGLSSLEDFEKFNWHAAKNPEILVVKMKAKYKEMFSEKNTEPTNVNVQINVGDDSGWLKEL